MPDSKPVARPASRQQRSMRTEQRLLDAALKLFRECGVEAVTVTDIASAAGVAPATIYRRFGDKEGLLKEAFARFIQESHQMLDLTPAERAHQNFVSVVVDVTALVFSFSRNNQKMLQSSYAKAWVDDYYAAQLVLMRKHIVQRLKQYLYLYVDEIRHPNPTLALEFILRQAMAMVSSRFEAGQLDVDSEIMADAVFMRELMSSILSYLRILHDPLELDAALISRGF